MFFNKKKQVVLEKKPIGIALFFTYTSCMGLGTTFMHPKTPNSGGPGFTSLDFHPFYSVDDRVEDNIKVNGVWFKEPEVFLFEGKTSDELILFKRSMEEKYTINGWTNIHQLYNDGLDVSYGLFSSQNHFHNKELAKQIGV